ncbi:MAG: hypothetical protein IT453_10330 [Planctomycetes bacterium]|nr:hypothetical protein [Planctomycetota bacterium]
MDELLDREQQLAIEHITESVQRLGDVAWRTADLRGRTRRHPWLATGLAGLAGYFGAPWLLRSLGRALTSFSGGAGVTAMPKVVFATLRFVRGRR